jgi:acetate kinase
MDAILVVNAGSSSLKFQVFATDGATELRRLVKGLMDGIGTRWSRAALPEMILDRASTTGGPS